MNEDQIKHMVDRFLGWKLPSSFTPDNGISFERIAGAGGPHPFAREPTGTNLFDATQADAMVRYMAEGMPVAQVREALELADAYESGLKKMEASGYEEFAGTIPNHKLVIAALRAYAIPHEEPGRVGTKPAQGDAE